MATTFVHGTPGPIMLTLGVAALFVTSRGFEQLKEPVTTHSAAGCATGVAGLLLFSFGLLVTSGEL